MSDRSKLSFETDRLRLTPLSMDDADLAIELFTDPEVMRFLWEVETEEKVVAQMPRSIRRAAGGAIGIWLIRDRHSGEKLGTTALLPLPIEEDDTNWEIIRESHPVDYEVELGYILKRGAWGRGIASEAAARILQFGFEWLTVSEIVAIIDDENAGSRNVLLKAGFIETGMRRAYNTDCPGFVLTRARWTSRVEGNGDGGIKL